MRMLTVTMILKLQTHLHDDHHTVTEMTIGRKNPHEAATVPIAPTEIGARTGKVITVLRESDQDRPM